MVAGGGGRSGFTLFEENLKREQDLKEKGNWDAGKLLSKSQL